MQIVDDKSQYCIPFILERLTAHRAQHAAHNAPPFFIGVNGVQGVGKTTLVSTLCSTLRSPPQNLPTVVISIDDFYLTHGDQLTVAASQPDNPLVQHRGQPGTHDLTLAQQVLIALRNGEKAKIPVYDKSSFSGQGDRTDPSTWQTVNDTDTKIAVVLFEGWCVGFRPLSDDALEAKHARAVEEERSGNHMGQLCKQKLASIQFVNDSLHRYNAITNMFDAFIQLDAENTQYVYAWRLEQETALRASKGSGMADEQVTKFVNGYYPAYELYTDTLRAGVFPGEKGKQLRLILGKDRTVKQVEKI